MDKQLLETTTSNIFITLMIVLWYSTTTRMVSLMVGQGAQIIDVGGESTRPGAQRISLQDEQDRVLPVIEKIKAGIFWPPNQDVHEAYDDFAACFPDGIENSVDADAFMGYQFTSCN